MKKTVADFAPSDYATLLVKLRANEKTKSRGCKRKRKCDVWMCWFGKENRTERGGGKKRVQPWCLINLVGIGGAARVLVK